MEVLRPAYMSVLLIGSGGSISMPWKHHPCQVQSIQQENGSLPLVRSGPSEGCGNISPPYLTSYYLWQLYQGEGAVDHVFLPFPHPDPCLFGNRTAKYNEGLECSPRLCFQASTVLLEDRTDLVAEELYIMLPPLPDLAHRDHGVNKAPGLRRYPHLAVSIHLRWPENFPRSSANKRF